MNLVDAHVRQSMLDYYSIFPTRNHVLEHLFLTIGNGYEWTKREEDGLYVLTCNYGDPRNRKRIKRVKPCPGPQSPGYLESIKFQNLEIAWTEKHIDVLCRGDAYVPHWRFPKPYPACMTYGRIAEGQHPPVEQIHPDWRAAVRKFAGDCMVYIRQAANFTGDDPTVLKQIARELYEPFVVCKYASRAFFSAQEWEQHEANIAAVMRLVEEIKKEEADAKA